jgi:hypothetical protein
VQNEIGGTNLSRPNIVLTLEWYPATLKNSNKFIFSYHWKLSNTSGTFALTSNHFGRVAAYVKDPRKKLATADVKVEALSVTEEVESKGRSESRPDGSPICAVAPPI